MSILIQLFGVFIATVGLIAMLTPHRLIRLSQSVEPALRFKLAVGFRVVMGSIMMIGASACRYPALIMVLGVITVAAGLIIAFMGATRLNQFVKRVTQIPGSLIRLMGLFAIAFGVLLAYAALPVPAVT